MLFLRVKLILKFRSIAFCFSLFTLPVFSQLGNEFWFVAPEVAQQHGDRPIVFRFATLTNPATVTIEQPANPTFPVQVINIAPNSAQTLDLTPWIDIIENKPADQILNYGFHITSTDLISAYYEVTPSCNCNPDIFSLKGENALGLSFYTPFQNFLNNASYARSAINLVASEDNTQITITPSADAVGHAANIPFNIVLNQGQTYCLEAVSTSANLHMGGSYITSDKPIAVTLSDDTAEGAPYGGCADLMGDQIIPETIIGESYIAIKGYLNGPDKIYILAAQNNTDISVDGVLLATINSGETYTYTLSNQSVFIETSNPTYVLHQSGFGCEVGQAILPPLDCTGSNVVTFTRSTNEFFAVNLLVQSGGEGNFLWNGNPGIINAIDFNPVPGSNGMWMFAQIDAGNLILQGQAARIENPSNKFHMGLIHGGSSSGCRYGYFSDFASGSYQIDVNDQSLCVGDSLILMSNNPTGGTNTWTFPNGTNIVGDTLIIPNISTLESGFYIISGYQTGSCEVLPDTIEISVITVPDIPILSSNSPRCLNDSTTAYVSNSGFYNVEWYDSNANLISNNDTIVHPNSTEGDFVYYAVLMNGECISEPDTITIDVLSPPVFNPNGPIQSCFNQLNISSSIQLTPPDAILSSSWVDINSGVFLENNNVNLFYSFLGQPTQIVSIENIILTTSGCEVRDTVEINYHPTPSVNVTWQDLCNEADIQFDDSVFWNGQQTGNNGLTVTYFFGDGSQANGIQPLHSYASPGNYEVEVVTSSDFCSDTTMVPIFVAQTPTTQILVKDGCKDVELSFQTSLSGLSLDSVLWEIPGFVESMSSSVILTDQPSGNYVGTLYLYTNNQCLSEVPFTFNLITPPSYSDLFLPNVITPNGDGLNDFFSIDEEFAYCNQFTIKFLNRWGDMVYYFDNETTPFNGKDNVGNILSEGVYFYIMEVEGNTRHGFVHIISD